MADNWIGTGDMPEETEKDLHDSAEDTAIVGVHEDFYEESMYADGNNIADVYHDGAHIVNTDEVEDDAKMTDAAIRKYRILRNAYIKLDSLPLSFGIPAYDDNMTDEEIAKRFKVDLADTVRETRINIADIEDNSVDEMQFENRIVYHALKRFRLTASAFFKFSTAVDGKTVDKTQVPKMLKSILDEYDNEYKKWMLSSTGSLWNRSATLNSR